MKSAFYNITKIFVNTYLKEAAKEFVKNIMYNEDENYFNQYIDIIINFNNVYSGFEYDSVVYDSENKNVPLQYSTLNDIYEFIDEYYEFCFTQHKAFELIFKVQDYFYIGFYFRQTYSNYNSEDILFRNYNNYINYFQNKQICVKIYKNDNNILYFSGNVESKWETQDFLYFYGNDYNTQILNILSNNSPYYFNYFKIVNSNNAFLLTFGQNTSNLFFIFILKDDNNYHYIRTNLGSSGFIKSNLVMDKNMYCYENNMKIFRASNYFEYRYLETDRKIDFINYLIIKSTDYNTKYEMKIPNVINHTYIPIYDTPYFINNDKYVTLDCYSSVLIEREGEE